jgi:pyruvate formate lyase activating enzyme
MPNSPLIFEIKGNALDDGPGIRSVVFFKGCPLSCLWCHNPESKRSAVEIGHDAAACIGCNTCVESCRFDALAPENPFFIDRAGCTLCFDCVEACPAGALRRIGTPVSLAEIVATVLRDKPFYDSSGGGVTLSGGEPTLSMVFAGELAQALKGHGVHVLLETCGAFPLAAFKQRLYPYLDMIYYDLKLMDDQAHQHYCGASNRTILDNFRVLQESAQHGGVPILGRVPLIPGITDTQDNLAAVAVFLKECGADRVALLPYHPMWLEKNRTIGIAVPADGENALRKWLPEERLLECKAIFAREGIMVS